MGGVAFLPVGKRTSFPTAAPALCLAPLGFTNTVGGHVQCASGTQHLGSTPLTPAAVQTRSPGDLWNFPRKTKAYSFITKMETVAATNPCV